MPWRYPPPGGFAGFAEQTPANQSLLTRGGHSGNGNGGTRRRRKKKAAAPKRRKKRASKSTKRGGKLKKGSPAAKARMAKLRKMRKK